MSKKIIIVIIVAVALIVAVATFSYLIAFKKSPELILTNTFKESFQFAKNTPFAKKSFKFESGEIRLVVSTKKTNEQVNFLFRRDPLGHSLISFATPEGNLSLYLLENNIVFELPESLLEMTGATVGYYKFKDDNLKKIKDNFNKVRNVPSKKEGVNSKTVEDIKKDFKKFSHDNIEWSKYKNNKLTGVSIKIPLLKLVDFISGEINKLEGSSGFSQDTNNEQVVVLKDTVNIILDDMLSDVKVDESKKEAFKKKILSQLENGDNKNSGNINNFWGKSNITQLKSQLEELKKELDPSDVLTFIFEIKEKKLSKIVILPKIKKLNNPNIYLNLRFEYNNNLLKTVYFEFPIKDENGITNETTLKGDLIYNNTVLSGIKFQTVDSNEKLNISLNWKINEKVPQVKVPDLSNAFNLRDILNGFLIQIIEQQTD